MPQKSGIGNQQSYIVATLYSGTKKLHARGIVRPELVHKGVPSLIPLQ